MKYYFTEFEDNCYQLNYWKQYMEDNNLSELKLFEAKMEVGNGYFFCAEFLEPGEVGHEDCGKFCEKYKPRNGKSGRCVHSKNLYEMTDKVKLLKNRNFDKY